MPRVNSRDEIVRLQRQLNNLTQLVDLLKRVRALHVTAYNAQTPIEKTSVEFFYAVGDLLEGQLPNDLDLRTISKEEFLKELLDG